MKRTFILTLIFLLTSSLYAQENATTPTQPKEHTPTNTQSFVDLINHIDWNLTEKQLIEKYPDLIRSRSHSYSAPFKQTCDYQFYNLNFEGAPVVANIQVDSISRKLVEIDMNFSDEYMKRGAAVLRPEVDSTAIALFGQPDKADDSESDSFSSYHRYWYLPKYNLSLTHMVFGESYICALHVSEGAGDNANFRQSKWGDSLAQVKAVEKQEDLYPTVDKLYAFYTKVAGKDCTVAFIFSEDKLVMAKYVFQEEHTNKNDYIDDYKDIVSLLSTKYGTPSYDSKTWKNDLYKDDLDQYGMAVCVGHLTYSAGWDNTSTDLIAALHGDNYKIELLVQYSSKKFQEMMSQNRQKERAEEL